MVPVVSQMRLMDAGTIMLTSRRVRHTYAIGFILLKGIIGRRWTGIREFLHCSPVYSYLSLQTSPGKRKRQKSKTTINFL